MHQFAENALAFTYSDDQKSIITTDGKIYATLAENEENFKVVYPESYAEALGNDPTDSTGNCWQIRVCIGYDDNGKCLGVTFQTVCE